MGARPSLSQNWVWAGPFLPSPSFLWFVSSKGQTGTLPSGPLLLLFPGPLPQHITCKSNPISGSAQRTGTERAWQPQFPSSLVLYVSYRHGSHTFICHQKPHDICIFMTFVFRLLIFNPHTNKNIIHIFTSHHARSLFSLSLLP